jgi:hypothetical protein
MMSVSQVKRKLFLQEYLPLRPSDMSMLSVTTRGSLSLINCLVDHLENMHVVKEKNPAEFSRPE